MVLYQNNTTRSKYYYSHTLQPKQQPQQQQQHCWIHNNNDYYYSNVVLLLLLFTFTVTIETTTFITYGFIVPYPLLTTTTTTTTRTTRRTVSKPIPSRCRNYNSIASDESKVSSSTTKTTTLSTTSSISADIGTSKPDTTTASSSSSSSFYREEYDQKWMFRNIHPINYDRYYYDSQYNQNSRPNDDNDMDRSATATKEATTETETTTISILLLNGFGMGTFHQHRLMKEIMILQQQQQQSTSNIDVYAMDYIGQGKSWPIHCNDGNAITENGLQYSAQTWMEQCIQFIEHVILNVNDQSTTTATTHQQKQVHIVGNSLGGYIATYIAALRPDLIASLCLLNATPIWGLNLPGWDGYIRQQSQQEQGQQSDGDGGIGSNSNSNNNNTTPIIPKMIGRYLFDIMRSTTTIEQFLNVTYVNDPTIYHPNFIQQIQSCCTGPGGHIAFASILWSPPITITTADNDNKESTTTSTNYYDCIQLLQQYKKNVLLCYGQNDPWCKPAFAKKILYQLLQKNDTFNNEDDKNEPTTTATPITTYIELSQVGHCPNHEAPVATALVLLNWISKISSSSLLTTTSIINDDDNNQKGKSLLFSSEQHISEVWGTTTIQERTMDEIQLNWMDEFALKVL